MHASTDTKELSCWSDSIPDLALTSESRSSADRRKAREVQAAISLRENRMTGPSRNLSQRIQAWRHSTRESPNRYLILEQGPRLSLRSATSGESVFLFGEQPVYRAALILRSLPLVSESKTISPCGSSIGISSLSMPLAACHKWSP